MMFQWVIGGGGSSFRARRGLAEMGAGGARVGAGRKAGMKMPKVRKIDVDAIMNRVGTGPDKMPLPFLLAMMHAPEDSDIKLSERIQCAIAAAPYCHPRLASVEVKTENRSTLKTQSDLASALKDLARIARLREAPVIDGDILEKGGKADIMSGPALNEQDIMSGLSDVEDKMSGLDEEQVDIMSGVVVDGDE